MALRGTKKLPLLYHEYECRNGPLFGSKLILTEGSQSTAWLTVGKEVGRYVVTHRMIDTRSFGRVSVGEGFLAWESRKVNRHARRKKSHG